jgi:glucokinase
MRILAADVGGTKTLLALFEGAPGALRELGRARYVGAEHAGLAPILEDFLRDHEGAIDAAAIGVAGPVLDDRCEATNIPWTIDARALEAGGSIARATVINDFAAVSLGIGELDPDDLRVLQDRPTDPGAPVAILGAGTGLGEALVLPRPGRLPRVLPTEGGHADFAARDELEIDLLRFLQARHGRVSVERAVSGPGLVAIHDFLLARGHAEPNELVDARADDDRAAAIGELGATGEDPGCALAVERFVALYGAEAGNLALKCLPYGGLYVAGGIAPKLIGPIEKHFMKHFREKGRMGRLLDDIRVSVVLDPRVGLLGARRAAVSLATDPDRGCDPGRG